MRSKMLINFRSITGWNLLILFFLTAFSTSQASAQDASVKGDVRARFIASKPKAAPKKPRIVVKKRAKASKVLAELKPVDRELELKVFRLINAERKQKGLPPLNMSAEASNLARVHSENMAKHGFFSHTGLNGRMIDERATDFGLKSWDSIGENIAFCQGFSNPAEFAVKRWMLSTGHRENLLHRMWGETGVGIAKTQDGRYYFTQIFIKR